MLATSLHRKRGAIVLAELRALPPEPLVLAEAAPLSDIVLQPARRLDWGFEYRIGTKGPNGRRSAPRRPTAGAGGATPSFPSLPWPRGAASDAVATSQPGLRTATS
jgi:hypothetical protein